LSNIHATAVVDSRAELDSTVTVGPYSVIGPHVKVAGGTSIGPHCVLEGHTRIGRDNLIFQFSSLGAIPQDKKYAGEPCELVIGDRNTIREFCTFNIGSPGDVGVTRVGNDNWIMAYVHVAHDCIVGNHTIFANKAQIAGHAEVGDWAILGGDTGLHQFVRVGAHAFTGIGTMLRQDVPPYVMVSGDPATPHGINVEGLKRRGFDAPKITALRQAYRSLYRSGLSLEEARSAIDAQAADSEMARDELRALHAFLQTATRGIVR
jgi:UDP-N-acetylglucosamine acyltransferase